MRGPLSEEKLVEIDNKLPSLDDRLWLATVSATDTMFNDLASNTALETSLICLADARDRFVQIRLALHEALACTVWYLETSHNAPNESSAIFTSKFYLDFANLLFYTLGEDIAAFIEAFLNLDKDEIKEFHTKEKNKSPKRTSKSIKIGKFIKAKYPNHKITRLIDKLLSCQYWHKAINYRNLWVHEKPPILEGLGIQLDRKDRIQYSPSFKYIESIKSSKPAHSIEELRNITFGAAEVLSQILTSLADILIERRKELGADFNFEKNIITFEFR